MSAEPVPAWLPRTTVGLGLSGVAVSGYLLIEHLTAGATLACPENSVVSCVKVTSSAQSALLGIPLPYWGLLFFLAAAAVSLPAAWANADPRLRLGRLAAAGAGVVMVFYLVWVELFVLDAICLWCTAIHVLTVAFFAAVAWGTAITAEPR